MAQDADRQTNIVPDVPDSVEQAAELQTWNISDFNLAASQEAAFRTIKAAQRIRLSVDDQLRLAETIIDPPSPGGALRTAARLHAERVEVT